MLSSISTVKSLSIMARVSPEEILKPSTTAFFFPLEVCFKRDILKKLVNQKLAAEKTKLEKIMTPNPRVGREDDEVLSWLRTMSNDRFRRLPVVDNQGKIKAIFTQGDFVSYTWPDLLYQATQMTKASITKHFNATSIIIMIMLYSVAMILAIRFV